MMSGPRKVTPMNIRIGRPDRRRRTRGMPQGEPRRADLIVRIIGTYQEMPGLALSLGDAVKVLGVRHLTCASVLDYLVNAGLLRRTEDGRYVWA
jgi:hypothetical protein